MENLERFKGMPEWAKHIDVHSHGYPSDMERAIERRHLDESIEATEETVDYLYGEFTPGTVRYERGTRPLLEMVVEAVCKDARSDVDRGKALVSWRRRNYTHVGKCGLGSEEEILLGWL